MKKLRFTYNMQIDYSVEVLNCNYTIKCVPQDTLRQKIEITEIKLFPETKFQWGKDGLGNIQIWGVNEIPHKEFFFQIEGEATTKSVDCEENENDSLSMVFAHPHGLNVPGKTIKKFFYNKFDETDLCTRDRVMKIMAGLYEEYSYKSGTTGVDTTAEEAFSQGCGVCQDYAHILISLLLLANIPARYVTGFIMGEGQTHAWVEYLDKGIWYGVDPTGKRVVDADYIKIGHGRDAKDCMVNRGIMHGGGLHKQKISVNVHEIGKG